MKSHCPVCQKTTDVEPLDQPNAQTTGYCGIDCARAHAEYLRTPIAVRLSLAAYVAKQKTIDHGLDHFWIH